MTQPDGLLRARAFEAYESIESLDLGGPTPAFGIGVIVERGSIRLTGQPNSDPLVTGEDTQLEADDDSGVQALGDEPARLLVVRMGEDDGTHQSV